MSLGAADDESTLREIIKCRTKKEFGTALWPHLFRDCLLTSVAIDQPDLMRTSSVLLGHTSYKTGEKHYNQAHMLHAGRRYAAASLRTAGELSEHPVEVVERVDEANCSRPGGI